MKIRSSNLKQCNQVHTQAIVSKWKGYKSKNNNDTKYKKDTDKGSVTRIGVSQSSERSWRRRQETVIPTEIRKWSPSRKERARCVTCEKPFTHDAVSRLGVIGFKRRRIYSFFYEK